jgi:predicted amidohydrolase
MTVAQPSLCIAVTQMTSVDDIAKNTQAVMQHLEGVAQRGHVDVVSFPENSLYMRIQQNVPISYLQLDNPVFQQLAEWSVRENCAIHLGALPLEQDGHRYNSTVVILPDGRIEAPYQKIHLFDVDLDQQRAIRESDAFEHGGQPSIWEFRGWKFGLSICYDMRFSELYRVYSQAGVDAILVPSAFTVPTGKAHWEVLLRARAIESQCYVIAAAQEGVHGNGSSEMRATYGHSLVVDPWGVVLADAGPGKQLLFVTLDQERIAHVRQQIPMAQHRLARPCL